jgi:hypothetical protein
MSKAEAIAIVAIFVVGVAFLSFMVEIWHDKWQRKQQAELGRYTRRTEQSANSSVSQPPTTQEDPSA